MNQRTGRNVWKRYEDDGDGEPVEVSKSSTTWPGLGWVPAYAPSRVHRATYTPYTQHGERDEWAEMANEAMAAIARANFQR